MSVSMRRATLSPKVCHQTDYRYRCCVACGTVEESVVTYLSTTSLPINERGWCSCTGDSLRFLQTLPRNRGPPLLDIRSDPVACIGVEESVGTISGQQHHAPLSPPCQGYGRYNFSYSHFCHIRAILSRK